MRKPLPTALELARQAAQRRTEKFHPYLTDDLLIADYAASHLDLPATERVLRWILERAR